MTSLAPLVMAALFACCSFDPCAVLELGCRPPPAPTPLPASAAQAHWQPRTDGAALVAPADAGAAD
jgi:hypothetical protein